MSSVSEPCGGVVLYSSRVIWERAGNCELVGLMTGGRNSHYCAAKLIPKRQSDNAATQCHIRDIILCINVVGQSYPEIFRHMNVVPGIWCTLQLCIYMYVCMISITLVAKHKVTSRCIPYYLVDRRSCQTKITKLTYLWYFTLRDRTDGRSAYNPHVSKACNIRLVSHTTGTRPCSLVDWLLQ